MAKNKHKKTNKKEPKKEVAKSKKKAQISKENEKEIKKQSKIKFKQKHPKIALAIKIILLIILLLVVVGAGILIGAIYGAFGDDFKITVEELVEPTSNSIIYDNEGNVLAELNGEQNRKNITLDDMSPYLANAYIAIEDERFDKHKGVDVLRTGKAIVTFVLQGGKSSFGGSTITQQLVKNITNDKDDEGIAGMTRKVKEWAKAFQIERLITKPQILELYLNTIPVGSTNYGVETGAYYYFNKSAHDLNVVECAFMAGINSAPSTYNPFGSKPYGENEQKTNRINNKVKVVLKKMLELNYISQEEYDASIKQIDEQGITFTKGAKTTNYSYHTDALINQLIEDYAEEKGISKAAAQNYIETSGLSIYSTQVASVQAAAQEAMDNSKRLKSRENTDEDGNPVLNQAAIVIIDHKTGYVLGCVGGVGEKTARGLNRATQSPRQPGSTIKPLTSVAAGLEEKIITAATIYNDNTSYFTVPGKTWQPKTLSKFRGFITVRQAIETSQNIPFAKVVTELTPAKGLEYLEKMGVTTLDKEKDGLSSVSLGGFTNGISPLEMAAAYGTIANDGIYVEPTFYTKVLDSDGNIILTAKQESRRVVSESTAYITKSILTEPVVGSQGTARRCAIKGIDVAAKTGTSNEDKDRWLCGFTNYYTAAVWFGYDDPEQVISNQGVSPATLIWAPAMKKVHEGLASSRFKAPSNIVTATICRASGKLASDTCTDTFAEVFEKGTIPESCEGHTEYKVCEDTGMLANPYCTHIKSVYKTYLVEKEKLGLWSTPSNQVENEIPTTSCTTHKEPEKPVEPEKPEEPKEPEDTEKPNKPDVEKPEDTEKPTDKPTTDKPSDKPSTGGDNKPSDEEEKPGEGSNAEEETGKENEEPGTGGAESEEDLKIEKPSETENIKPKDVKNIQNN